MDARFRTRPLDWLPSVVFVLSVTSAGASDTPHTRPPVMGGGLPQRFPLAHTVEGVHVLLAVAFAFEAGITIVLVDSLSLQIRKPRLDIPGRDEDRHSFIRLTSFISRFDAGAFNLFYSGRNVSPVGINEYNQRLLDPVLSCSVVGKFLPEPFPHELLTRPTAFRADFDPLHPDVPACSFQEPSGKCLVLPIFAQDNYLNVPAHCSHPLAITSDSLSPPSTAISLAGRTVVAPELSRLRTIPRSPPR